MAVFIAFIASAVASSAICATVGYQIAKRKDGMAPGTGLLLGLFLGVIGLFITAFMKPRSSGKTFALAGGITAGLLIVSISATAVAAHVATKPGFYNMNTLEQSVQQQVNVSSQFDPGASVQSCDMTGSNTASCIISDLGQTESINVIISNNGNTWAQQ